jgi:serine/threonine-protein kinase
MASDEETWAAPSVGTADTITADLGTSEIRDLPRMNAVEFTGRYEAGDLLGRGGMGEVRSLGDKRIGRDVAMKVIRSGHGTVGQDRFLREARVQGQLEHPSVVPVYDLGLDPNGAPFFTMKSLQGRTLSEIIKRLRAGDAETLAQFGRRRLLGVFVDVCQAVAYAHKKGVVHRDIKPSNVMAGDFGQVYVLDWGVAKLRGEPEQEAPQIPAEAPIRDTDQTPQTEAGAILGTPGYMAPEQFSEEPVDVRADVYALGVLLFELLFLEPMHRGKTATALMMSTLDGIDWDAWSEASEVDAPPELVAVCEQATRRRAGERFEDVPCLLRAVERYLEGDRDLALRRELTQRHLDHARGLLAKEERAGALRELGRALALDPHDSEARELMRHVFLDRPKDMPQEVVDSIRQENDETGRKQARQAAWTYLSWVGFAVLPIWMGMRDWTLLVIILGLIAVEVVLAFIHSRAKHPNQSLLIGAAVLNMVLVGVMTRFFGPFVLTPVLAAVAALAFVLHPLERGRLLIITAGAGAIAVPWALEHLGVLAPSYAYKGDHIEIAANAASFTPLPTELMLVSVCVGAVIISGFAVSQIRGMLRQAQERVHLQAWQLRQVVPAETD